MRYINDATQIINENTRLKEIYKEKDEKWKSAAQKCSPNELTNIEPLFNESLEAFYAWQRHLFENFDKLTMEPDD